jgi:hypothetical protein
MERAIHVVDAIIFNLDRVAILDPMFGHDLISSGLIDRRISPHVAPPAISSITGRRRRTWMKICASIPRAGRVLRFGLKVCWVTHRRTFEFGLDYPSFFFGSGMRPSDSAANGPRHRDPGAQSHRTMRTAMRLASNNVARVDVAVTRNGEHLPAPGPARWWPPVAAGHL